MHAVKKIGKELEWWLRELRLAPEVLRQYGTRFPKRIRVPGTNIHIHIDPEDRRARKQVLFDLVRGRVHRNSRFWRDFVAHTEPTTALDIGANYGECVFSMEYPQNVRVVAVEANPELIPHLLESLHDHPSAAQIEVINALVSDKSAKSAAFYLNRNSSGQSTAVASIAADCGDVETVAVATIRIDDVFSDENYRPDRLVFKVDVEGFEPKVLRGMSGALGEASLAIGYVEVDSHFLSRTGWTIERYDEQILGAFQLYVPVDQKSLMLKRYDSLAAYRQNFGQSRIHTDLVLVKNRTAFNWLPPAWQVAQ